MRIRIDFDGASTDTVRELAAALAGIHAGRPTVGCDGPEKWAGTTPSLTPNQFAYVVARLVKVDGETIAATLDTLRGAGPIDWAAEHAAGRM